MNNVAKNAMLLYRQCPRKTKLIVPVLAVAMSMALTLDVNPSTDSGIQFLGFKRLILSFAVSCGLSFYAAIRLQRRTEKGALISVPTLACSLLYSAFMLLGQALQASSSFAILYLDSLHVAWAVFRYLGLTCFTYCLLSALMDICRAARAGDAQDKSPWPTKLPRTILFTLIIAASWLFWFILFYPGAVPTDTARQLAQFFGTGNTVLDNHFPYFTSLVLGSIYRLGMMLTSDCVISIALLALFQLLFGSIIFGTVVKWVDELGAPRWVTFLSLAFCAGFPLFSSHAITISKDFLHACLVSLFSLQVLLRWVYRNSATTPPIASWHALVLVAILVALTRNNGVFISIPTLLVLAIATKSKKGIGSFAISLLCIVVWQTVVLPYAHVQPGEAVEALSAPSQIVGRALSLNHPLTEEERRILIDSIHVDFDALAEAYNPQLADGMKGSLNTGDDLDVPAFLSASLSIALRHPGDALAAILNTTYGFWYPFNLGTYWQAEGAPYWCSPDDAYGLLGTWFTDHEFVALWSAEHADLITTLQNLRINTSVLTFLYRPGTYTWILLFCLCASFSEKRHRSATAICILPFLLLMATLLAGPCSSIRYSLPFIFSLPIFLLLLFGRLERPVPST